MKADALARVVLLLVRSRSFRGLLVVSLLAATVALATSTSLAALRLSPEQSDVAYFGATQAYLQPLSRPMARPGEPIPDHPVLAELGDGVEVIREGASWPSLRTIDGGFDGTLFAELALPSPILQGNTDLVEGRWPRVAGECVATADLPERTGPPLGSWELTVVGRIRDAFVPHSSTVACAPGTWERWQVPPEQLELIGDAASYDYYLAGDPQQVEEVVDSLIERGRLTRDEVSVRSWPKRTGSASRFLFDQLPMVTIPVLLAAVLGGLLARWGGAVSRALERAGVPRRPLRYAVLAGAVLGSTLAAALGALLGAVLGIALRPVLVAWVASQPLSPWRLLTGEIVAVVVATAVGTAAGYWLGDAFGNRRLRQLDAPARPLGRAAVAVLLVLAAGLAAGSTWSIVTSREQLWPMVLGVVGMVLAGGLLAPVAVALLGRGLAGGEVSARTLAGRIVTDDALRWGVTGGAVTAFLGVVIAMFLVSTASLAGLQKALASDVPPGTVVLEVTNPDGNRIPQRVKDQFERDLQLRDPVRLTELSVSAYPRGMVQFFGSVTEAEQVLGSLPAEAVETLQAGGILVLGGLEGARTTIEVDDSIPLEVPVMAIKPEPSRRLRTGFGFGVLPAMPAMVQDARPVRQMLIYQGLTPAQDELARNWADTTGYNVFQIDSYRPDTPLALSAGVATGLAGFGLLAAPLLVGVLRREVNELRPLAVTLRRVGLSPAWIRPAFTTAVLLAVLPAAALAVAGPFLAVALLASTYPAAFDLPGVPWWALVAFLAGVVAACSLATGHALRALHRRESPVTI